MYAEERQQAIPHEASRVDGRVDVVVPAEDTAAESGAAGVRVARVVRA